MGFVFGKAFGVVCAIITVIGGLMDLVSDVDKVAEAASSSSDDESDDD